MYYHRDVPEGMKEVTEEEIESIRENQTNSALNRKLNEELMPQWQSESEITYVEDVLFGLNISVGDDGTLSRIESEPSPTEEPAGE